MIYLSWASTSWHLENPNFCVSLTFSQLQNRLTRLYISTQYPKHDVLSFLTDFPLFQKKYTSSLDSIHNEYSDLCHPMTDRYFDIDHFFSPNLLLFKSEIGPSDPVLKVAFSHSFLHVVII